MLTIVTKSSTGSATFDDSYLYRYRLTRILAKNNQGFRQVTFIMLNPSTADADQDDPTIRACSQFAQRWGYNQLNVVNLFAFRTPHPSALAKAEDPIGPDNDRYLLQAAASADKVILAWGNRGNFLSRNQVVLNLLAPYYHNLYCLQRNHSGQPRHPLYIKRTRLSTPWNEDDTQHIV